MAVKRVGNYLGVGVDDEDENGGDYDGDDDEGIVGPIGAEGCAVQ